MIPWTTVVLLRPSRLNIQAFLDKPSGQPLHLEVFDDLSLAEEEDESSAEEPVVLHAVPMHITGPFHIEVGSNDLVTVLGGPGLNDFAPPTPAPPPSVSPSPRIQQCVQFLRISSVV